MGHDTSPPSGRGFVALSRAVAHLFYRVDRLGERLPAGRLLLVANHGNALLDPILIAATAGRPVRFLAKSTLFDGPFGPLLRWTRAIPVYRRLDPGVDAARNVETFEAVRQALAREEAVCLFPEGISHGEGRLEPIRTGAARMALAAAAQGHPPTMVAAGLYFESRATFRSRVIVAFGPPFPCEVPGADAADRPRDAVRLLTDRIAAHLRDLMVEADPESDADVAERVDRLYAGARGLPATPGERLPRLRLIARGLAELRSRDPRRYQALRTAWRAHQDRLRRFGLLEADLGATPRRGAVWRFALRETAYAVVLVPLAAAGFLTCSVPYLATDLVARALRPSLDVRATVKVVAGTALYGLWFAGLALAAGMAWGVPFGLTTLLALPPIAIAGLAAVERETAVLATVRSYVAVRRLRPADKRRLIGEQETLVELLDQTRAWLERPGTAPPAA